MQIGLKEVEVLSLFFFNCLFFCICHQDRLQESIEELKLNGIHYVLIYTNEDNLFLENQITRKKDTKALSVSSMEDFLK